MFNERETKDLLESIAKIATGLKYIGNGNSSTDKGAIENLAISVDDFSHNIGEALYSVADAMNNIAAAIRETKS